MNPDNQQSNIDPIKAGPLGDLPMANYPEVSPTPTPTPDMVQPKKMNKKVLMGVLAIVGLMIAGGVVALQSSGGFLAQNQDTRSRAACISCGGGSCPDGWSYGADSCAPQSSCGQRATEACSGHQGGGSTPRPTTNPTSSGGGSDDCTGKNCGYGSCFTGPNAHDGGWGCTCQNGTTKGPSTNPGTCPAPTTAPTSGGGGTNDCTGKSCGAGTCFTGPNANDGGWGCNCNDGTVKGPSTNPGTCAAAPTGSGTNDCTGKSCGAGTCFTGPNANDGGWGCNCNDGTVKGPSTNPGTCAGTGGGTACGGSGQRCCDPFSNNGLICTGNLYCNSGTCQTAPGGNICGSGQGEGGTPSGQCAVFTCGNKCNKTQECNLNRVVVPCASASLNGQCGQIDYLNGSGGYCGVKSQNCGGSCAGTTTTVNPTTTTTNNPTSTITTTIVAGQCTAVKLWTKDATGAWVNTPFAQAGSKAKIGDTVRLSTIGSGRTFTSGRFRIKVGSADYGAWLTTSTKDKGEYYINYVIPSAGTFAVQAQVL